MYLSKTFMWGPVPTRSDQGYADNLCRHPIPTGLTHGPPIGKESLPKGHADEGMPTTWARAKIFPGPPPVLIDVHGQMVTGFGSGGWRLLITVRWRPERCAFEALLAHAEPDESREGMPTTYADKVRPRVRLQPTPTPYADRPDTRTTNW